MPEILQSTIMHSDKGIFLNSFILYEDYFIDSLDIDGVFHQKLAEYLGFI